MDPASDENKENIVNKTSKNMLVGAAIAGMMAVGLSNTSLAAAKAKKATKAAEPAKTEAKVDCKNGCKGKSECKTATTACAGKNECGGKGWIKAATEKECTDKGGTVAAAATK